MLRRNDISMILIIVAAMALLFLVALPPLAHACTLSLDRVHVSPNFHVIVSHDTTPIPGIQVEVYDEGERQSHTETEQKPVLTLVTGQDGVAEITDLGKGTYLVATKGHGGGSAVYAIIGDRPEKIRNEITLQWPFSLNEPLKARSFSADLLS